MKSFFKKVLLFVIDAVTLILAYYVSYYATRMLGMESSTVLINSSYIFAAVKIIIYLMFVMYSTKSTRNFILDVIGIIVANAAACALAMFLFNVDIMNNIVALAIVLVWDMLIGLMIRFLIRNPASGESDDDYEDEDDYFASSDRDKLNDYTDDKSNDIERIKEKENDRQSDAEFSDTGSLLSMGNDDKTDAEEDKLAEDEAHKEYMEKIALLENELKAKEDHIDQLENDMALSGDMDFESFAPSDEEDEQEDKEENNEEPNTQDNEAQDNNAFLNNGYDSQQYNDPYASMYGQYPYYNQQQYQNPYQQQPPQWPQNPYDTNYNAAQNENIKQKATELYMEQHRQELLDGILKDIKSMYSTLSTKTKSIEEKEYDLLLKYVELDEREKTLAEIKKKNEARLNAFEVAANKRTASRMMSDDMMLPSDNLALTKNIKKTLDILQNKKDPPFVLAEEPNEPFEERTSNNTSIPKDGTLSSQLLQATGRTMTDNSRMNPERVSEVSPQIDQKPVRQEAAEKQGIKDASYQAAKLREMLSEEAKQAKEKKERTATSPIEIAMKQTREEMGEDNIGSAHTTGNNQSEILSQIDKIRHEIKGNNQAPVNPTTPPDYMKQSQLNDMYEAQRLGYEQQQRDSRQYTQNNTAFVPNPYNNNPQPNINRYQGANQQPAYIPGITNPNMPIPPQANNINRPINQPVNQQKPAAVSKPAQTNNKPKQQPKKEQPKKEQPKKEQPKTEHTEKKAAKKTNSDFKDLETGNLGIKSEEFDNISSLLDDL